MEKEKYELLRKYYLESYKNTIACLIISNEIEKNFYSIQISKKAVDSELSKVKVIIRSTIISDSSSEINTTVVLPNNMANDLIDDVREEFLKSNKIIYRSINPRLQIESMHSDNFSLNILLDNNSFIYDKNNSKSLVRRMA